MKGSLEHLDYLLSEHCNIGNTVPGRGAAPSLEPEVAVPDAEGESGHLALQIIGRDLDVPNRRVWMGVAEWFRETAEAPRDRSREVREASLAS